MKEFHGLVLSVVRYCSPLVVGMPVEDEHVLGKAEDEYIVSFAAIRYAVAEASRICDNEVSLQLLWS